MRVLGLQLLVGAALLGSGAGCAHLGLPAVGEGRERESLWEEAHGAWERQEFARADTIFQTIGRAYPESREGKESWFFRGALRMDPRNPAWDPEPAEEHLRHYLAGDSLALEPARRVEGRTLLALAEQLNAPPAERIEELQLTSPTRVETRVETRVVNRPVVVRAERSEAEVAALRARVRTLEAELERIRRTLAAPSRP